LLKKLNEWGPVICTCLSRLFKRYGGLCSLAPWN
jgi:hypothetical protein